MAKKEETISLIDTFSEFKELKNNYGECTRRVFP